MENTKMTDKQYDLLFNLNKTIESLNEQDKDFQELINDSSIFGGYIDDIQGDIEYRIEIFKFIKRYKSGELKEVASIGISNTMAVVIVEAESDYVFGYMPFEDEKHYFLSEIEYKFADEEDNNEDSDTEPMFTIGEDGLELSLSNAMRFR